MLMVFFLDVFFYHGQNANLTNVALALPATFPGLRTVVPIVRHCSNLCSASDFYAHMLYKRTCAWISWVLHLPVS